MRGWNTTPSSRSASPGACADVVAENADAPGLDSEQPRDQREQRALAGAVEAEQRGEARRRDGEVDVDRARAARHRNG